MDFSRPRNFPQRSWIPSENVLTYGIDVQEGVLDQLNGDYIGAVYSAEYGALGTGVLIQNNAGSSWQYAIQYANNGKGLFSVDGLGNIVGSSLYVGGAYLNGDPVNGSMDVGNLANSAATPYIDLNGFGTSQNNVRMINDANGQLTINTVTGGNLQINSTGVYTTGSFHVNLATPCEFVGALHRRADWRGCEVYLCLRGGEYLETLCSKFLLG